MPVTAFVEDDRPGSTAYIHPIADVLWLVRGPEDAATEALTHVSG